MPESRGLTVGRAIQNIMPTGTVPFFEPFETINGPYTDGQVFKEKWASPPVWPTDLFAVAAHVVYMSGLLTYFQPDPDHVEKSDAYPPCFTLTAKEREECYSVGAAWANRRSVPKLVKALWRNLVSAHGQPLRASRHTRKGRISPVWWKSALKLVLVADEACVGLGAPASADHPDRWMVVQFEILNAKPFDVKKLSHDTAYRARRQRASFGIFSDPDVACVQPKSRISSVGCNLRNLTRNAAYIPHAGSVRCHWQQPIASKTEEDADDLDVLIVPIPFVMRDEWIVQDAVSKPDTAKRPRWGNFEIEQRWLDDEQGLIDLVMGEFRKAQAALQSRTTAGALNGVVFPEYALTEPLFNKICALMKAEEPGLEFAITGSRRWRERELCSDRRVARR